MFSHVEPWLDAHNLEHLWYYDGPPDTPEKVGRSFASAPERCLFMNTFTTGWRCAQTAESRGMGSGL